MKTNYKSVKDYLVGKSKEDLIRDLSKLSEKQLNDYLMNTIDDNDIFITQVILEAGANVNAMNGGSINPLIWAASRSRIDLVKLFLDFGADVNVKSAIFENIPLIQACSKGNKDIVQLLLDNGAYVNAKSKDGFTLLSATKNVYIKELLKKYGAKE